MTRYIYYCHSCQDIITDTLTFQSINVIEDPNFRDLVLFLGRGAYAEEDIPHRTKLTEEIIKAWKEERKQFSAEMKVCLISILFHAS